MIAPILDPANYSFTIHAASSILVGTAIAALALYVLIKEHASRIGLIFCFFSLCISIWLVTFGIIYASLQKPQALFWMRFSQMGVTFIPTSALMLASAIVQRSYRLRNLIRASLAVSAFFAVGVMFSDLHIKGAYVYSWGYYPQYGPLGVAFFVFFMFTLLYVVRCYWIEHRATTNVRNKNRLKGLMIAHSIGYLAAADFLPAFGVPLYPIGYIFVIPFLFITAHIVTRYRLVDITPELAAGQILETMQGAVIVVDLDGKIQVVNRIAQDMLEHQKSDLLGRNLLSFLELPTELHFGTGVQESGASHEMTWHGKQGRQSVVSISTSPITDKYNDLVGFVYVAHDITERKRAEEDLKKRNAFIETILNNLPIGLAVNTIADGKTIYLNTKFEEIYGWPRSVLADVGEFFNHVYPDPDYRKKMQETIMADIASNDLSRMRWEGAQIATQRGTTKFVTAVNIPLFEQDIMISTVQDVTERLHAEKALNESEKRYKRLVESVTDYIYEVKVENGRPVETKYGAGCFAVTGYTAEEYAADPDLWNRIVHPADRTVVMEHAARIFAGHPANPLEHRIIHKKGSLCWVRNTAAPRFDQNEQLIDFAGMIRDITPLKQLEAQLRQAQKMEAVGQLAGGVAHDFNNILTAIVGYGNLLVMKLPEQSSEGAYAHQILASAERAAHLTHSLLAFSRKQYIDLRPVDVNAIIGQVEKLLVRVIGEDIEFKTSLSKADLPVLADSVQIEQVLMNLATNARDAMSNGGILMIETDTCAMGEDFLKIHAYGEPGPYALIAITDTGAGMNEDIRSKIFEPFFTTKEVGKGTGLGLSMVYGIIKQHNGYVNVYSEPGKGTTFKIYLPLIAAAQPGEKKSPPESMPRGREIVLLAEDNNEVRTLMRTILENFGYRVIEAVDGEDALQKFREHPDIDLLVSDIIMPRKNGNELYQELKKIRPGMKALFTSGYTANIVNTRGILDMGLELVLKPLSPAKLLQKVREVLDKK